MFFAAFAISVLTDRTTCDQTGWPASAGASAKFGSASSAALNSSRQTFSRPFTHTMNARYLWARAVAAELGIAAVVAGVRPEEKARVVADERDRGRTVAMVGDGINDAPALAAAHVGIAVGTGTDIAIAAADVALLRGGIAGLPTALRLARRTLATIRQNLFWAFIYNVLGIPLAAMGLLSPVIASAAMAFSSVSVVSNALLLRRWRATASAQEARS